MTPSDDIVSPVLDPPPPAKGAKEAAAGEALTKKEVWRRRLKKAALLAIAALIAFLIYRALSGDESLPGIASELPEYRSSIYGVSQPMGVAVSPDGNRVYVTETGGRRLVRIFDGSGNPIGRLKPPGQEGKWRLPVYVAVEPRSGDVYVSDRLRELVDVYDEDGRHRRVLKPRGRLGKGANPLGLAFGAGGDLFMTDVTGGRRSHRVLVFGAGEEPLRRVGARGAFWFPNGVAVDSEGGLYVSDSNNGRLAIFDPSGRLAASIQRGVGDGDLGLPRGVAVDDGKLYVVDTTAHTVKVYELAEDAAAVPSYVGSFGIEGIADGSFQYPNGIAVDGDGRVYVTDRENNRLQVWER